MPPPGPISLLASHLRSAANTGSDEPLPIRIPSPIHAALKDRLQNAPPSHEAFEKAEAEDLVDSLGDDVKRWCSLEESSFAAIAMVFIFAKKSMARVEGVFKLYKALESMKDGVDVGKRTVYKNIVGEKLIQTLITFFLDARQQPLPRRWVGLLLVELLETEENREALQTICGREGNTYLLQIGKMVVEGNHRIPKHVCGSLVSELAIDASPNDRKRLLLSVMPKDAFDINPFEGGEHFPTGAGAEWEDEFTNYLLGLEIAREKENLKIPMCFAAIAVKINYTYVGKFGGVIGDMSDMLTLRVPTDSKLSHHSWIDIDLSNIQAVKVLALNLEVADLHIQLCDYKEMGYMFLLDMKPMYNPGTIIIQVRADEAGLIKNDLLSAKVYRRQRWNKTGKTALARTWLDRGDAPPTSSIPAGFKLQLEERGFQQRREDLKKDVASPPKAPPKPAQAGLDELPGAMTEQYGPHLRPAGYHNNVQPLTTPSQEEVPQARQGGHFSSTHNTPEPAHSRRSVSMASETQDEGVAPGERFIAPQGSGEGLRPELEVAGNSMQGRLDWGLTNLSASEPSESVVQPQGQGVVDQLDQALATSPKQKPKPQAPGYKMPLKTPKPKDIYDFTSDDEPVKQPPKAIGKRKAETKGNKKVSPRKKPKPAPKSRPKGALKREKKRTEFKPTEQAIESDDADEMAPSLPVRTPKSVKKAPIKPRTAKKPELVVKGGDPATAPETTPGSPKKTVPASKAPQQQAARKKPVLVAKSGTGATKAKVATRPTQTKPPARRKGKSVIPAKRPASPHCGEDQQPKKAEVAVLRRSVRTKHDTHKIFRTDSDTEIEDEVELSLPYEPSQRGSPGQTDAKLQFPRPAIQPLVSNPPALKDLVKTQTAGVSQAKTVLPPRENVPTVDPLSDPEIPSRTLAHNQKHEKYVPITKQTYPPALPPTPEADKTPHANAQSNSFFRGTNTKDALQSTTKALVLEALSRMPEKKEASRKFQLGSVLQQAIEMAERTPSSELQLPSFAAGLGISCEAQAPETDTTKFPNSPGGLPDEIIERKEHATHTAAICDESVLQPESVGSGFGLKEPMAQQHLASDPEEGNSEFTMEVHESAESPKGVQIIAPAAEMTSTPKTDKETMNKTKAGCRAHQNVSGMNSMQAVNPGETTINPPAVEISTEPALGSITTAKSVKAPSPQVRKQVVDLPAGKPNPKELASKQHGPKVDSLTTVNEKVEQLKPETPRAAMLRAIGTLTPPVVPLNTPGSTPLANTHELIDEKLTRKPRIIKWNIEGPMNQGKLIPKTPVSQKTKPQTNIQPESPEVLSGEQGEIGLAPSGPNVEELLVNHIVGMNPARGPPVIRGCSEGLKDRKKLSMENLNSQRQLYQAVVQLTSLEAMSEVEDEAMQISDCPGTSEFFTTSSARHHRTPSLRKQLELEGENSACASGTDDGRKSYISPGIENDNKQAPLPPMPMKPDDSSSDDEALYSMPKRVPLKEEDVKEVRPSKKRVESIVIIAGEDEDYILGRFPKESTVKSMVVEKLNDSFVKGLLPVRRKTVESTGSPLPKLLSSQKDMKEANSQNAKTLKSSALPFSPVKREPSPSIVESPPPKLPTRIGDSVETPIVLEDSSPDPPEETPRTTNFIRPDTTRNIAADHQTPKKVIPDLQTFNTGSGGGLIDRKVRFGEISGLPVVSSLPSGLGTYSRGPPEPQYTTGFESVRAWRQERKPHIKGVAESEKLSTRSSSYHAPKQWEPPQKERVDSRGSPSASMSDEMLRILSSSQRHLFPEKLKEGRVLKDSTPAQDGRDNLEVLVNPSPPGRFFASLVNNHILSPKKGLSLLKLKDKGTLKGSSKALVNEDEGESVDDESDTSDDNDEEPNDGYATDSEDNEYQEYWRTALPDYHRETLSVLEKISKHWIYYLMSREERAYEVLNICGTRSDRVVEHLRGLHLQEFNQFLQKLEETRGETLARCQEARGKAKAMVPRDLSLGPIKRTLKKKNTDLEVGIKNMISIIVKGT